ncbi:MAG: hypothetical protein IJ651_07800, partial [Bacteroidales bacterium]|nr:hypothetical protein [Bacteroidales bacterium]
VDGGAEMAVPSTKRAENVDAYGAVNIGQKCGCQGSSAPNKGRQSPIETSNKALKCTFLVISASFYKKSNNFVSGKL